MSTEARYYSNSGNDANDGLTPATPWKTAAKFRLSQPANSYALFQRGGDWRDETAGSNGQFEYPQDGIMIADYGDTSLAKPLFGFTRQASVAITSVVRGASTATVTAPAHGMTSSGSTNTPTVVIAGVTGAASAVNGYWYATVTGVDTFTVPLTGGAGETSSNGTTTQECGPRAAFFNSGKSGCSVANVRTSRANYATFCTGTFALPFVVDSVDAADTGRSGFISSNGTCSGNIVRGCTSVRSRDDAIDFSGSGTWSNIKVSDCTLSYAGFEVDGATPYTAGGVGDAVSFHALATGDVWNIRGTYLLQSGIAHVSTAGTNRVWNCWFDEWRAVGIEGNSGATLIAWNNRVAAPQVSALDGSNANFCMEVKTTSNGEFYNNTVYSNKGSVGANSVSCMASRGTGTLIAKNNRFVSNGTAYFWVVGASAGTITTGTNSYSHSTGTMFQKSGNKTLAQWQSTFGYDLDCVTGASIATVPPALSADWNPTGGLEAGTNLASLGIAELLSDCNGYARPTSRLWDIGAVQSSPSGYSYWAGARRTRWRK